MVHLLSPVRTSISRFVCMTAICGIVWASGLASNAVSAQQDTGSDPLSVMDGEIDNRRVYSFFLRHGMKLVERQKADKQESSSAANENALGLSLEEVEAALKQQRRPATMEVPLFDSNKNVGDHRETYRKILKGSLLLGTIYDCGRCDNLHANIAGGVVISEDGLALTNYHVLEREEDGVETLMAMTYDGQPRTIQKVLYANKTADIALIQLGGSGPFHPVPIASSNPYPSDPVQVLSHPSGQYFVLTTGVVSRTVRLRGRRGYSQWMEITADFGGGSSGSGIFNQQGELIGLVSRIQPLFRGSSSGPESPADPDRPKSDQADDPSNKSSRPPYAEMILRRCVSLDSIRNCFQSQ